MSSPTWGGDKYNLKDAEQSRRWGRSKSPGEEGKIRRRVVGTRRGEVGEAKGMEEEEIGKLDGERSGAANVILGKEELRKEDVGMWEFCSCVFHSGRLFPS